MCSGRVYLVDTPDKENPNRKKRVGKCSVEPRLHTYDEVDANWVGYPPSFD